MFYENQLVVGRGQSKICLMFGVDSQRNSSFVIRNCLHVSPILPSHFIQRIRNLPE
jgi:hypothetical protein